LNIKELHGLFGSGGKKNGALLATRELGRKRGTLGARQWIEEKLTVRPSVVWVSGPRRESPALTIIELLQKEGSQVSYNDPYIPFIGKGRKYDLQMESAPLDNLGQYDCVLIVTDHSNYNYEQIVQQSQLVVDTRNATRGIQSTKIVHC
jgi:hypothetical protein